VIAYNIGIRRLAFMNIQNRDVPEQHIVELDKDESFLSFLYFKSFEDIGFYPGHLRIECCSSFLYLTLKDNIVRMNLLLLDPFYEELQIALFKSSHVIDYADFNEDDII